MESPDGCARNGTPERAGVASVLESVVPSSIVDAMPKGEILQVVTFSALFGAACTAAGKRAAPVIAFMDVLGAVMTRYTRYVMYLAPAGVLASMAATMAHNGPRMIVSLTKYFVTALGAEAVLVSGVLLPIAVFARIPLKRFLRVSRPPVVLAFSTASSQAVLPVALSAMERFGVPKHVSGFVLPAGMSFNLAGANSLYGARQRVRHSGDRGASAGRETGDDAPESGIDQQGSGGGAACLVRNRDRDPGVGGRACGSRRDHSGGRCHAGYGSHRGEYARQLPGGCSHWPLGGSGLPAG